MLKQKSKMSIKPEEAVELFKTTAMTTAEPSLKYGKKVFDELECKMMPPTRDGRDYSGYNLFIHTNQATIKEIIRLEYEWKGVRLTPPQVAGKLWKADKKAQVLYNLAVQWVNAWNNVEITIREKQN